MTHLFHPLHGGDFEFVAYRQNWGEDRFHLHDEDGHLFSVPAGWTDVAAAEPFVVIAAGRCPFTVTVWVPTNLCHLGRCPGGAVPCPVPGEPVSGRPDVR